MPLPAEQHYGSKLPKGTGLGDWHKQARFSGCQPPGDGAGVAGARPRSRAATLLQRVGRAVAPAGLPGGLACPWEGTWRLGPQGRRVSRGALLPLWRSRYGSGGGAAWRSRRHGCKRPSLASPASHLLPRPAPCLGSWAGSPAAWQHACSDRKRQAAAEARVFLPAVVRSRGRRFHALPGCCQPCPSSLTACWGGWWCIRQLRQG